MKTGRHDDKVYLNLTVSVCESDQGGVDSTHDFLTPEDQEIASEMDSGGNRQIAYALFSEALLREVHLDAMLKIQDDPGFLKVYQEANEEQRALIEGVLGDQARTIMQTNLLRMCSAAAKGVLEMLVTQVPGEKSG